MSNSDNTVDLQTDDAGTTQVDPNAEVDLEMNEPVEDSEETEQEGAPEGNDKVQKLRDEAAQSRIKLREVSERLEGALERVRALTVATTGDVLADPLYSLEWSDDWNGDDGLPDPQKVRNAAEALAQSRPFLARGPRGNVGQGEHSISTATTSLSELLRQAR